MTRCLIKVLPAPSQPQAITVLLQGDAINSIAAEGDTLLVSSSG
jgi:hypothetical protein